MLKLIGGIAIGVVIGAVAVEIITRRMPGLVRQIEDHAETTAKSLLGVLGVGAEEPEVKRS